MAKKINGETYYYVDTTYDDDMIYDIYQNENGSIVVIPVSSRY